MKLPSAAPLLRYLEKHAGQKIKLRELRRELAEWSNSNKGRKGDRKGGKPNKKNKREPQMSADAKEYLEELLSALEELDALRSVGNGLYQVRKPFLLRGKISFSPKGVAFVNVRGTGSDARDVFVAPPHTKDALSGDQVLIRLKDRTRDRFEGEVLDVVNRSRSFHRMRLLTRPKAGGVAGEVLDLPSRLVAAADVSRLSADAVERLEPDIIVIVKLTGKRVYHQGAQLQEAIFERFEDDSDLDPDFARIMLKYDLQTAYPNVKIPKADEEPNRKNVRDWNNRRDLRDLPTITIDGAESKDFDDALTFVKHKRGTVKLFVHIADVSYYVEQNSELDKEARRRATSYYLANWVVPMLPPALSENLCSLVAHTNRLAFTAEMEIRLSDGKLTAAEFYKSVIRVDRRLTYETAENILEGANEIPPPPEAAGRKGKRPAPKPDDDDQTPHEFPDREIADMVRKIWKLAQSQRKRRMKFGRIDLDIPEAKIKVGKNNSVESINYRERLKSSMLIEECMLSANTCVAAYLKKHKAHTLYRVHDPMDPRKAENLNQFFGSYNIPAELKDTSGTSLQKVMRIVEKHVGGERLLHTFHVLMLRSFMQAVYSPDPRGHWGLGFENYCHFTSPIRRYPDLVVHRSLQALIQRKKQPYTRDDVDELAIHTSEQERTAMEAERDIFKLKVLRYVRQEGITKFTGFITGIKFDRVFLEIEGLPAEAVVMAFHLTDERELLLPDRFSAYIKALGRPAFLGEEWQLELDRLDLEDMRIYCKLAEDR